MATSISPSSAAPAWTCSDVQLERDTEFPNTHVIVVATFTCDDGRKPQVFRVRMTDASPAAVLKLVRDHYDQLVKIDAYLGSFVPGPIDVAAVIANEAQLRQVATDTMQEDPEASKRAAF